ncbi:acetyl-CoA synthetase-like protein [Basidiobolus meristosporus CBS 931.73]|uniref:Acetyl-CoA synthetase-like protein n=1 Tax=Basidiobolus meristosporus CBS 931.73 TaxID=1314790 RepID=A0A1Y1XV37_9FUNG|nr:acetyl-CoA synthetase-like protein [Basidiobolus meristosporus CBS 931.73]|eukprot:ORX89632.1 acetyl-CoA synthetase-like protein [Basidiobolus meristosporus CBS 931.73]
MRHTLGQAELKQLLAAFEPQFPMLPIVLASNMCILVYRYTDTEVATLHFSNSGSQDGPWKVAVALRPEMSVSELLNIVGEKVKTSRNGKMPTIVGLSISLYDSTSEMIMSVGSIEDPHGQVISILDVNDSVASNSSVRANILSHWSTLLKSFSDYPDEPISRVNMLSSTEMALLTSSAWSSTPPVTIAQIPSHQNVSSDEMFLHTIFENTAKMYPSRIAILYEDSAGKERAYTYQDVENSSSLLAKHLYDNYDTGPGRFIGLMMPQMPEAYIAMLAILKTGSAYVPIDPSYPVDRIEYILEDSRAELLLSKKAIAKHQISWPTFFLDDWLDPMRSNSLGCGQFSSGLLKVMDVAYMIYTSGTTGRPKGVVVEHRNVVSLIKAEYLIFNLTDEDRVYQQFSIAFDASIEEIWLPFMVGGALVPATQKPGPGLSDILEAKGVTVLSCVPTLLTMLSEDEKLQSLRLLILGGEACSKFLVERFGSRCRMVNSYGPTEATVIATWKACCPQDTIVTIGRPVPGYSAFILSEHDQLQPIGIAGELVIGGPGVTRGYHNQPDLTKKKFIQNKLLDPEGQLYKTGDLARFTPNGEIEYLGRIDTQVKLRGYRIELSEVESALQRFKDIQAAVVDVYVDSFNVEHLVAYITLSGDITHLNSQAIKEDLLKTMPYFMVPSIFQIVQELPTLPSGKIDRKSLPKVTVDILMAKEDDSKVTIAPRTPMETMLVEIWSRYFTGKPVSVSDNFFDLGGHSLLAAMLVTELRQYENTKGVSMGHIYQYAVLEHLASFIDSCFGSSDNIALQIHEKSPKSSEVDQERDIEKLSNLDRADFPPIPGYLQSTGLLICQFAAIFTVYLISTLPTSLLYLLYKFTDAPFAGLTLFFALDFCWMPLIAVCVKWVLIGRYRPGKWPVWGYYYWRWWVVHSVTRGLKLYLFEGSPLLNVFYKLMGANIDMTAYIGSRYISCFDLLTIDANASIGLNSYLNGYKVESGWLIVGSGIHVHSGARVGNKATLGLSCEIHNGANLDDLSVLQDEQVILENERWAGSPAKLVEIPAERDEEISASCGTIWLFCTLHLIIATLVNAIFGLLASLTGIIVLGVIPILLPTTNPYITVMVASPVVAITAMLLFCLGIALLKLIVLPKITPGKYGLRSIFYLRKWCLDLLMHISLEMVNSVYGTLYAPHWLRTLGAKIGKTSEVSTVAYISPNLLRIGNGCFLADSVVVGPPHIHHGKISLDYATIEERSFIGNGALFPAGVKMGKDSLLGVLSTPDYDVRALADNTSWLGSPAIFLPNRQKATTNWPKERTYAPTKWLYLARYLVEFWRVFLPNMVNITSYVLVAVILEILYEGTSDRNILQVEDVFNLTNGIFTNLSRGALIGSFLFVYLAVFWVVALGACCFVLIMKWLLVGTYRKREAPLWSSFVWRQVNVLTPWTELSTALQEGIADKQLIQNLCGTPLVCAWFRLLGSKIGKRVWMDTLQITEADLIHIEDDVSIGADTILQTHLFEDRIMKMDALFIGCCSNIDAMSVILYSATLEENVSIGSLSLVMKGETLPAHSRWNGIPLRHEK